jgi:hypothetical protein
MGGYSLFGFASKQFRNPAVKIGQVICFHVNKVNMDNRGLKSRTSVGPSDKFPFPIREMS